MKTSTCPPLARMAAGVLLLVVFPASVLAQGARVEGIVRDTSGASVPAAQVALRTKSYSAATATDANGAFSFENVSELSGAIVVTAKGFQSAEQKWRVESALNAHIEIILSPQPLSQVVLVTAARHQTTPADVPAGDIQVTSEELATTPALTLDDSLRQVPGFSLFRRSSSRTANPTTQGVSLRGLGASGASRALVLEDGIPLNDPFGGWVYWDRVPKESVDSIELAQEGASSLYGSDALGGVVQFLTRSAVPAGLQLETSYGNQNTPDFSLWTGGRAGPWESSFGGQVFRTDGYILVPSADRGSVDTRAGSDDGTADLRVGRKIGEASDIFARGWFFDESRRNGTPLQTNNTRLGQGALGADLALGSIGQLTLRFYGDAQTYHQNFSAVSNNRNSETLTDMQSVPSQGVGDSAQWSRSAGKRHTLVAGFDAIEVIGRSNETLFASGSPSADVSSGGRQRTIGVFGEDLFQIAPRWLLAVSARFDHWRNFDASSLRVPIRPAGPAANTPFADRTENAFNPRLTLLHRVNSNISWSGSVYRAFRAPTLNELYRSFRQGNVLTESNSALSAERLTGGESGVAISGFEKRLEVRGTFFFNEIINPIANVTLTTTPMLITRQRQNLGRTRAPGLEINATTRITHDLRISGGYQYVAAVVDSFPANTALVGLRIPQVPRHVLTFQARYENPARINVAVFGRLVGKQFDDDQNQFPLGRFFVLDAMVSRTVGAGVGLFAAAENLLNEKYATAATPVPQLGLPITARFGLRFRYPPR